MLGPVDVSAFSRISKPFRINCYFSRFWRHLSPFRMNTSKSVSKQRTLSAFRMNTYEKQGRGWPVIVNQKSDKDSCPACPDPVGEEHRDEGSLFPRSRITRSGNATVNADFEFQFSSFFERRVTSIRHRAALPPEIQMGNDVEQDQGEGHDARDDAEPREHEPAFVPARRRRGYSKHEVQPPEYSCQEFDHDAPEEMRRNGGNSVRHRTVGAKRRRWKSSPNARVRRGPNWRGGRRLRTCSHKSQAAQRWEKGRRARRHT